MSRYQKCHRQEWQPSLLCNKGLPLNYFNKIQLLFYFKTEIFHHHQYPINVFLKSINFLKLFKFEYRHPL